MVKKRKIRFYIPRIIFFNNATFLPVSSYIYRMCYDKSGKYPDSLEWMPAYFAEINTLEMLWNSFQEQQPDIVCLSLYLFNRGSLEAFAAKIKEEKPETTIIIGGPEISHRQAQEFADEWQNFDFMIYGDGEEAFPLLMDAVLENDANDLRLSSIPNLIFRESVDNTRVIKTPHKRYKGQLYTENSPWLYCQDEFVRDCEHARNQGLNLYVAWDSDRGCPYDCSFCDWAAGLHHKVTRKVFDPRPELLMIAEQGCTIMLTNANFGFYEEDVSVAEYIFKLIGSGNYPNFRLSSIQWAKLNKDRVMEMYRLQGKHTGQIKGMLALQSINPDSLDKINRPAVPWPQQKEMIYQLRREGFKVTFTTELILCLPSETVETWDNTMEELMDLYPTGELRCNIWHVLPNSPGADPAYLAKHKLKVFNANMINMTNESVPVSWKREDSKIKFKQDFITAEIDADPGFTDSEVLSINEIDRFVKNYSNSGKSMFYNSEIVLSSDTATVEDALYMMISIGLAKALQHKFNEDPEPAKLMHRKLRPLMRQRAEKDAKRMLEIYDHTGLLPLWLEHDGNIYMYNLAWESPDFSHKLLYLT